MNEEIEEVIQNVERTDSQKSVATSNVYSLDFTDSSSEKHNSSGMETYVLEWDSEGSESPHKSIAILTDKHAKPINVNKDVQCETAKKACAQCATTYHRRSIVAQEIFTQTSKTIIELAKSEGVVMKPIDCNSLETQTSFISIRKNKTYEYSIEMSGGKKPSLKNNESMNKKAITQGNELVHTNTQTVNNKSVSNIASESPAEKKMITNIEIVNKESFYNNEDMEDIHNEYNKLFCNRELETNDSFSNSEETHQEFFSNEVIPNNKSLSDTEIMNNKSYYVGIVNNKLMSNNAVVNDCGDHYKNVTCNQCYNISLEDCSSKLHVSETDYEKSENSISPFGSEKVIGVINKESRENVCDEQNEYDSNSDYDQSVNSTDIEEDSLMEPTRHHTSNKSEYSDDEDCDDTPKSVDRDVAELYTKLSETIEFQAHRPFDQEKRRFGYLTPLTEESVVKKDSSPDVITGNVSSSTEEDKDVLFTNKAGIRIKLFPKDQSHDSEMLKLPPIQGPHSASPNMNFLFSLNPNKLHLKSGPLPCVFEERRDTDRWEMGTRELASGESPHISVRGDCESRGTHGNVQLPPIHLEGYVNTNQKSERLSNPSDSPKPESITSDIQNPINIKDKIKELKMSHKGRPWIYSKYNGPHSDSRSGSPSSIGDDIKPSDPADRGCELLCGELLKRLRLGSWYEIMDTLEDIPRALDKFWNVISEHRIAELLRQVTAHVESPRTRVARAACSTLAVILKNTNYTKKPDFYEAVTILLIKTGSFSRPVRRAANVALDEIVCGVDLSHMVTALCIHGATHKSALVRSASARLLVVCCALGGGGRELLRARPPSAAAARRHALRSLAVLLDDKSTDTRKYAERLYSMLRPLTNFVAYYLTDVDVDLASKQMKKYDQLLRCLPESR